MQEYFEIGQIVNTFGIKGIVKVIGFTDNIKRFDKLKKVWVVLQQIQKQYDIEEVKYHKNMILIKFKGIDKIEDAEKLKNAILKVERKDAIALEEGSYYIADLLGMKVYTDKNVFLGILEDIYNTGSNDIYVVRNEIGKQILLPAIDEVIKQICLEENKIIVHILEGLV